MIWSILEKAYGDSLTPLNEVTCEANGKPLDMETKYGDDIEALVDDTWPILEEAFGHPPTRFNLRLRIMKATQPLSDKTVETDPNKAATWLLQYELYPQAGRQGVIAGTSVLQYINLLQNLRANTLHHTVQGARNH